MPPRSPNHLVLLILLVSLASCVLLGSCVSPSTHPPAQSAPVATVVDAAMSEAEAFDGLSPNCPAEIRQRQTLLSVSYYGFDGQVHRGQIVIDRELAEEVQEIFAIALNEKFPITSVIPVSAPQFRDEGELDRSGSVWSDRLSMAANNTSGFNYRWIEGTTKPSTHSIGRAIDINPRINPYIRGETILPPDGTYAANVPGTLTEESVVTRAFLDRGWEWGGHWTSLKDYQHFEKPRPPAQP